MRSNTHLRYLRLSDFSRWREIVGRRGSKAEEKVKAKKRFEQMKGKGGVHSMTFLIYSPIPNHSIKTSSTN